MRKTHYKYVMAEGFQSLAKPIKFPLDSLGLNLTKGVNGVGKSSIINAILWAEFGVNLKKNISTWSDRQPTTYRGTRVLVERTDFVHDYLIVRHLNFKGTTMGLKGGDKLMIFKKPVDEPKFTQSHLVGDGLHKSDMQAIISEQLGMQSKAFMNSIIFGQRLVGLIGMDNKEKRDLFDELFDVDFVDAAKEVAKERKDAAKSKMDELDNEHTLTTNTLQTLREDYDYKSKQLQEFDKTKAARVAAAKKNLEDKEKSLAAEKKVLDQNKKLLEKYDFKKLDELKALKANKEVILAGLKKDYEAHKSTQQDSENEVAKLEASIVRKNKELEEVNTSCPTCTQSLPKDSVAKVKKNIKDAIKKDETALGIQKKGLELFVKNTEKAKKAYENCQIEDKDLQSKIDMFNTDREEFIKLETSYKLGTSRVSELESEVKNFKQVLDTEKAAKAPEVNLEAIKTKIDNGEKVIAENEERYAAVKKEHDQLSWWITKGFGASGLKSFVFNAMLTQLNTYAHAYSEKLGFRVEFSIDSSKASRPFQTVVYDGEYERDYEDFSGGQKQRVDICIAFAMHDLISRNSNINILMMDEFFEGLDNEGIETAFELIRAKAATKSVFLITHADLVDTLNARSILLELDEDKNTYIKM